MERKRPNPEKLLERAKKEARKEKRGKLKIYLGAAPGVGKTTEMLVDALEVRKNGLDVVAGIIESHGRKEIEAKLKFFEILPRQLHVYHDKSILEFDLQAALRRQPALILIDEMAHTNVSGLLHTKRWQDIKELLDRGIDVYTTLNVQHIESLNDSVAQIIGARINETVPDSIIEMADTIELIDLPPNMLLKRLQEGKVYFPAQAMMAREHFFREGNLIALRELALRVTALHVNAEVLLYRQDEGIKTIWAIKDKILVCVGPKIEALKLIRAAKRIATSLKAEWIAVYIETPHLQVSEKKRYHALKHLRMAEQLGATTRVLSGFNIAKEIVNFAREQNVTQIMIWKYIGTRWRDWIKRNLADEIVRQSSEIDVYIMTGNRELTKPEKDGFLPKAIPWKTYGMALGIVIAATLIDCLLAPFLEVSNLIMVYLIATTIIALFGRIGPSLFACLLTVLAYGFFFIPPYYSFAINDIEFLFTLIVMLIVSQIVSYLTILVRLQAQSSRTIQRQTSSLYNLSRQLSNARGTDKLLDIGIRYIVENFDSNVLAFFAKNNHLTLHGNPEYKVDLKEQSIIQWVYELGQTAGFGTDTLSFSKSFYVPLLASSGSIGVLSIQPHSPQLFTPEQRRLIEACANQVALALEVDRLQERSREQELKTVVDEIQNTLLQAVTHDLRVPITAMMASASNLMESGGILDRKKIKKIGKEIYDESEQLSRFINNILQIIYLESKQIKLHLHPSSIKDVINRVLNLLSDKLKDRPIQMNIPKNLALIPFDPLLIQEVLVNLIENAIKFTPEESLIMIDVEVTNDIVTVSIKDRGPGIVDDEADKLFEKFYRGRALSTERGLGLGLAICYEIIAAHGGIIWAENSKEGGGVFRFTLG